MRTRNRTHSTDSLESQGSKKKRLSFTDPENSPSTTSPVRRSRRSLARANYAD